MRTIILAALAAMAIGLIGSAQTIAAPAQGGVIGIAAASTFPDDDSGRDHTIAQTEQLMRLGGIK
jgi:hypothetical protein